MGNSRLLALGLLAMSLPAAASGIYRCTSPSGAVTYQEIACSGAESGGVANIPTSFPDMNVVEHERILQQGAMADARLLKRYEIDSHERIANADRASRERIAEMQLAQADSGDYGYGGYGMPYYAAAGARLVPIYAHRTHVRPHAVPRAVPLR